MGWSAISTGVEKKERMVNRVAGIGESDVRSLIKGTME
jgi:hypothetical protein